MEGTRIRHPPAKGLAVELVHGVLSSGETCGRHANGVYWPGVLNLEPELPDLGVYVFTNRTGSFSGTFSITDDVTPRSLTNFTASSLNPRRNFRLSMDNSNSVETPYLGVHEIGSSSKRQIQSRNNKSTNAAALAE